MIITLEWITGVNLGFELVDKSQIYEMNEEGWIIIIDLLILRVLLENSPN